jgi:aspartyl protease family protein
MKAQSITLCLVVLATVAVFMPRQETTAEGTAPAKQDEASTNGSQDEAAVPAESGGETTLKRDDDGHFYADLRVDGREVTMMVDTGASFIALTPADAEAADIDWREDDAIVVGHGASGPVRGVPVTLDEVELGDHRAREVQAAVIVDGLKVSLLGQSFLQQIDGLRIEGDRMILGRD